jgi:hypothetical protein
MLQRQVQLFGFLTVLILAGGDNMTTTITDTAYYPHLIFGANGTSTMDFVERKWSGFGSQYPGNRVVRWDALDRFWREG